PFVWLVWFGVLRRPVFGVKGRERARCDELFLDREPEHGRERQETVLDRALAQLALAVLLVPRLEHPDVVASARMRVQRKRGIRAYTRASSSRAIRLRVPERFQPIREPHG